MTTTDMASRFASANGSILVVPQSTVTNSVALLPASMRTASVLGPYPSNSRSGMWISGSSPQCRTHHSLRIQPVAPQLSGQGMADAEKGRGCFDRERGGKRHEAFRTAKHDAR